MPLLLDFEDDMENVPHISHELHEQEDDSIQLEQEQPDEEVQVNDIKVVHHPNAGITKTIFHFDDYCGAESFTAIFV